MCNLPDRTLRLRRALVWLAATASALGAFAVAAAQDSKQDSKFPGVGRPATPAEVKAWDIDVRPDFKGLPPGAGSVATGQEVWEAKCESCHGTFGESNEFFTPIVGGTTAADVKSGRVANLLRPDFPQRTTLMKLSHVSTLWDYINRAMPWNAPKSLSVEEVYAVTAYILNLGDIVPADFVLSDRNIAEVQAKLPNRNGLAKFEPLWDVSGKGDVANTACMADCKPAVTVASALPDFARDQHGNLADQSRLVGATRGAVTTEPAPKEAAGAKQSVEAPATGEALAAKHACNACHVADRTVIGPGYVAIAKRYRGQAGATEKLIAKMRSGGAGAWGAMPMPPQPQLSDEDARRLVQWVLSAGK
jgi:S-disulfanyl-L-cysteine oxidoreductase SoxD